MRHLITLFLILFASGSLAYSQKDGEMEEFDEVDPYTKGDRQLEKKLGYAQFGFVPWRNAEDSKSVQENMGGIPMLWVETEHFRIGSSLGTYKLPNDREERGRFKDDITRLKKKLGKLKAPKKKIDPYLLLHIYAQRAEDQYDAFIRDFSVEPEDYLKTGPNLGHKNKFLLILCQRKSEFGRYVRTYHQSDINYAFRTGWYQDGMVALANVESIREHLVDEPEAPVDTMFHCLLAHVLANNFVDGYDQLLFNAPAWLVFGYGHFTTKRIDERYTYFDGRKVIYKTDSDEWSWQPRVRNLVKNDFFTSAKDLFAQKAYDELHARDHMTAWSRTEFLLNVAEGEPKTFLKLASAPLKVSKQTGVTKETEFLVRQERALAAAYKMTPEEFDKAWSKWVLRTYKKK
ncbi:MAG: hypothetical protein ACI8X5_001833 [Planctomycetota bacterium]|jgi:hypothetical protein